MQTKEAYARAAQKLTAKGLLEIESFIARIGKLLDLKNPIIQAKICTGKYRGTFDYSIAFDAGYFWVTNIGNKLTKAERSTRLIDLLRTMLNQYMGLFAKKGAIFHALQTRAHLDNQRAATKNLHPYVIKRVGVVNTGFSYIGWPYVVLEIDGRERFHTTTCLHYELLKQKLEEMSIQAGYFPAGGYKEEDIDFIYNGIGFNSLGSSYTCCEGVIVISA